MSIIKICYKDNDTFVYTIGQEVNIPDGQKGDRTCQSDKNEIINGHLTWLKEYYEIVDEARLLSGFVSPHMLISLQKCISYHETKQASKFQSDLSSNCFTSTFEI